MEKPAITSAVLADPIARRWSPRAFDANTAVTPAQLMALLEAARWAPSCFGDQPWRFVVWNKAQDEAGWQRALETLAPSNQVWAVRAPVLILVCHQTLFGHNQQPNRWASYDTGAAAENLCVQAASMGLITHQMGGFDSAKARELAAIPQGIELMAMLAVGYPGEPEQLTEELKTRELAPRQRKPLGELFYSGVWESPIL